MRTYLVRIFVEANSAEEAIRKSKKTPPTDVYPLDEQPSGTGYRTE